MRAKHAPFQPVLTDGSTFVAMVWRPHGEPFVVLSGQATAMTNVTGTATAYEDGILATPGVEDERGSTPSAQELEVMRLIATGAKDYVIARRLGVSIVTVRRRVVAFRNRVGATTRSEAVARAATLGMLGSLEPVEIIDETQLEDDPSHADADQ